MNEYKIINTGNDDLVSIILEEMGKVIKESGNGQIQVIETYKESQDNKGIIVTGILLAVAEGLVSAVIYDLLKEGIKRFRKTREYNPSAVIEIEYTNEQEHIKIKVQLNDILKK